MGLTSRHKRPLNHNIPHLKDTRLIIIAAEGTKTEKHYFESDLFRCPRVQVKVLETDDNRSAPNYVLSRLKKFAVETDLQADDQLWLMVDKDRWPDKLLAEVCAHAFKGRTLRIRLAVSNPCFEFWLYLHNADWAGDTISSVDMVHKIRKLLGSYNKSNIDIEQFRQGVADATVRAKSMDTLPTGRWPHNPGTHVYKVVEEIWTLDCNVDRLREQNG